MPKALDDGWFDQNHVDAIDFALYGFNSDVFRNTKEFTITQGDVEYKRKKHDLTMSELTGIAGEYKQYMSDILDGEIFNELCMIFPNFAHDAKVLKINSDHFTSKKSQKKILRRIKLVKACHILQKVIWYIAAASGVLIAGAAVAAKIDMGEDLIPSIFISLLAGFFFGAGVGLIFNLINNLIFTAITPKAIIGKKPSNGYLDSIAKSMKKLFATRPDLTLARVSDFPNLDSHLRTGEKIDLSRVHSRMDTEKPKHISEEADDQKGFQFTESVIPPIDSIFEQPKSPRGDSSQRD